MKVKIQVSEKNYQWASETMLACGFELDDDADFIFLEKATGIPFLKCRKENENFHIPLNEILYFESIGHNIHVHTSCEIYRCSSRLWQLEKELDAAEFLRISHSVIIARNKVIKIKSALSQKFHL